MKSLLPRRPLSGGIACLTFYELVTSTFFDCGPLTNPENGLVFVSVTILGSTAHYSCNAGFVLIGLSF